MQVRALHGQGYGVAILSVIVVALIAALFFPLIGTTSAGLFIVAVIFTARFGGTGPAFLSLIVSVLVADFFFISPRLQFGVDLRDAAWITILIVVSFWVMWLADSSRAAGRAVREREESFRVTLASVGEAVITTDTAGRVTFMNPTAQNLTGWLLDESVGRPVDALLRMIHEHTRQSLENPVSQVLQTGEPAAASQDICLVSRDGTEKPIEDSASPIRDDEGRLQGVVLVIRDVTEKRRSERAVREAERLARVTLDALPASICVIDETGTIVAVNRSWRYFSRSRTNPLTDDGVGMNYLKVCERAARQGCDDAAAFAVGVQRVLAGVLDSFSLEYALEESLEDGSDASGFCGWYIARVARFSGHTLRGVVVAHENVTSLKLAQAELRALNETLEQRVAERTEEVLQSQLALRQAERLAAIGEMMTALSHESRNAIQRSSACLELLARRFQDDAAVLPIVEEARRAQKDLQRVLAEVRDYAAPINLEHSWEDLARLWRETWEELHPVWQGRHVALIEPESALPHRVRIDAFRFRQVFRNLFENSLQACVDPVVITVTVSYLEGGEGPRVVRLSVRDNGPGAHPEDRDRVFEPFYTTKPKGTGLGMAIVKRIVEAHGGNVALETAPGAGFEVIIHLPDDGAQEIPDGLRELGLFPEA